MLMGSSSGQDHIRPAQGLCKLCLGQLLGQARECLEKACPCVPAKPRQPSSCPALKQHLDTVHLPAEPGQPWPGAEPATLSGAAADAA